MTSNQRGGDDPPGMDKINISQVSSSGESLDTLHNSQSQHNRSSPTTVKEKCIIVLVGINSLNNHS